MIFTNPITDYIPKSILTAQQDLVIRGAAEPERLAGLPIAFVYRSGNQAISTATYTDIQLNFEVIDAGGNFDSTTNYRFDVPHDMYAFACGQVLLAGSGGTFLFRVQIEVNGSARYSSQSYHNGANPETLGVSGLLELSSGDYVSLNVYQTSGVNQNAYSHGGQGTTYMGIVGIPRKP